MTIIGDAVAGADFAASEPLSPQRQGAAVPELGPGAHEGPHRQPAD